MLKDLHVRNLAVLESAAVELGPGLNVLSGETGAGKSIVVDSLALLAGARASTDLIRGGEDLLIVSGVFEPPGQEWRRLLAEAALESDGPELVIRREVSRSGRNRVMINDQPVTLRLLSQLAPHLLRIHTQREELGLMEPELQRHWLDRSGGGEAEDLLARVAAAFAHHEALALRLERAMGSERTRRERIDLLRFQVGEIERARLTAGEDEELRRERDQLRHREAIVQALSGSHATLFEDEGAVVDRLAQARAALDGIALWEPQAGSWSDELAELAIRVEEIASALRTRLDGGEADPARLDAIEERLLLVERLCRKYGPTAADVLAEGRRLAAELGELEGDVEQRDHLERAVAEALTDYRRAALELSVARARWGEALAGRVHAELAELALGRARFAVRLERRRREGSPLVLDGVEVEHGAHGVDQVVFLLAANPGEELAPLARIASGGELSRVYLALQLAVRGEGRATAATLVFDEVDAGIGGAEAAALGRKLRRLARGGQTLAVTHLPQVASHADLHFKVAKKVEGGRTRVGVERLDDGGRIEEVARMLAGKKVTDLSRSHARELISVARGAR